MLIEDWCCDAAQIFVRLLMINRITRGTDFTELLTQCAVGCQSALSQAGCTNRLKDSECLVFRKPREYRLTEPASVPNIPLTKARATFDRARSLKDLDDHQIIPISHREIDRFLELLQQSLHVGQRDRADAEPPNRSLADLKYGYPQLVTSLLVGDNPTVLSHRAQVTQGRGLAEINGPRDLSERGGRALTEHCQNRNRAVDRTY